MTIQDRYSKSIELVDFFRRKEYLNIPQVYFTKMPKRIMIGSENRGNPERKQIMCNIVLKSSYSLLESSLSLQGFESRYSCACMSKPRCVHDLR